MQNHITPSFILLASATIWLSLPLDSRSIAADWQYIGSTSDFAVYVDKQSIEVENNIRKYWVWTALNEKETDPISGQPYTQTMLNWEGDCTNDILKIREVIYYSTNRNVVSRTALNPPITVKRVPNTFGDIILKYVCNSKNML
jgi:hypothetical protein